MIKDEWLKLLTSQVKEIFKEDYGLEVPDFYASYKARISFVIF